MHHILENRKSPGFLLLLALAILLSSCQPNVSRLAQRGDLEGLLDLISEEQDLSVRVAAVQAIGEIGGDDAAPILINFLAGEEEDIRLAAARALGTLGDPQAIQPLINALTDQSQAVQDASQEALEQFGDAAVSKLIESLKSINPDLRTRVIDVLSQSSRVAVPEMMAALTHPVENVRLGMKAALTGIGSPAVPYLMAALSEDDDQLNRSIFEILVGIGEEAVPALIAALTHNNRAIGRQAFDALVEIGEPAVKPAIAALKDEGRQEVIGEVLMAIGEPSLSPLVAALADPAVAGPAGDVLIMMGLDSIDPLVQAYEAAPEDYQVLLRPLVHGLKIPNAIARNKVKQAVVSIGEPAVPLLLNLVRNANRVAFEDETYFANPVLDGAFGQVEGELIRGGLCDSAGQWQGKIVLCQRGEITFYEKIQNVQEGGGVGVIHYNNVPGAMLPMVLSSEESLRIPAVALSEEEGETLARAALKEEVSVISEDMSFVNETAVEIGEPAISYLIDALKEDTLYYFSEEVLIAMGDPAVDPLIAALEDDNADFRSRLVYTLGKIGGDRAEETIIEMLGDPSGDVRWQAAYSLGELQSEQAVAPLVALLDDGEDAVVRAGHDALVQVGLPAVEPLLAYYHDEDAEQAETAESALREIFEDHAQPVLDAAIRVCNGEAYTGAAEYDRYGEEEVHPLVVVTSYEEISYLTDSLPVDWLPFTPGELELVVCLGGQEKEVVQVCRYYYSGTGGSAPSTTRYRYKEEVKLMAAQTAAQIAARTFRGSNPDYCPYQKTGSLGSITGDYISNSEIVVWLNTLDIPLAD